MRITPDALRLSGLQALQGKPAKALFDALSKSKQKKLKGGAEMSAEVEGSGKVWTILRLI